MNKVILILTVLLTTNILWAQNDTIKGNYEFTTSLEENEKLNNEPIKQGYKIKVSYVKDDTVYYNYWNFSKKDSLLKINYNNKTFSLPLETFQQITRPVYPRYKGAKVGVYTVPFRLRGVLNKNSFDFEASLSLQSNLIFGFGTRKKPYSLIDASIGIGLTSANLNNINSTVTQERTASAFTVSLGVVIKPEKQVNIGIFGGWDFLGQKDQAVNWIYDKKFWIGIGINVALNEIKNNNLQKAGKRNNAKKK